MKASIVIHLHVRWVESEARRLAQRFKAYLPFLLYVGLGLVILGPLLLPGFVLTLDMVFTPRLRPPDHVDNTFILYWALHLLNVVLPADAVQKALLMCIFVVAGVGMHRLVATLRGEHDARMWNVAAYVSGL